MNILNKAVLVLEKYTDLYVVNYIAFLTYRDAYRYNNSLPKKCKIEHRKRKNGSWEKLERKRKQKTTEELKEINEKIGGVL